MRGTLDAASVATSNGDEADDGDGLLSPPGTIGGVLASEWDKSRAIYARSVCLLLHSFIHAFGGVFFCFFRLSFFSPVPLSFLKQFDNSVRLLVGAYGFTPH